MDDRHLLRLVGLAVPVAVWVLGVFPPPRGGLTPTYLATYTGLLLALILVDQTAPRRGDPLWRKLLWLGAELLLCFLVVLTQGTLVRPALVYILPASRALLMFGERPGLALSGAVWLTYGANILRDVWADRLHEFPNYLPFFLGPYALAVLLTLAALRQAAHRRRVEALYEQLSAAHRELQALHARAREAAVAEERNRLAREIHDSVAHYLTVVNVQLEAAEKLGADQPERAAEQVRRARRLTLESLSEVRRSVAALRAATIEQLSLPRALDKLAGEFSESTGIAVRLELDLPRDVRLPPETALALYRTAQEGLTNVQRHARASSVRLVLARQNGHVELSVEDDGVGPTPAASESPEDGGFGLLGLRERIALLGGRVSFGPVGSRHGARLSVSLPAGEAT